MPAYVITADDIDDVVRVDACDCVTAAVGWVAAWWPFDASGVAVVNVDRVDDGVITESRVVEVGRDGRARVVECHDGLNRDLEKAASRSDDARALATGEKTREQLKRENNMFDGVAKVVISEPRRKW
jgi:hypothetical protein